MEVRGAVGTVSSGARLAYRLGAWSLARTHQFLGDDRSRIIADVREIDPFWSTQTPFRLSLDLGGTWWSWNRAVVRVDGKKATIFVEGEPDVRA